METVRLGAVGLGWFGGVLAEAARASGEAEVVVVLRALGGRPAGVRGGTRLRDRREPRGVARGSRRSQGVIVATPHSTHAELIEQAAAAGKHVFVEKPLALTVADARRAIEATDRAGVTLQVGHNRRRQPANRRIRSMVESGELGTVMQLEGFHSSPGAHKPDLPAWRTDPDECPGRRHDRPRRPHRRHVQLSGRTRGAASFAFSKKVVGASTLDEATAVTIEYESGPIGQIGTSYFVPGIVVARRLRHGCERLERRGRRTACSRRLARTRRAPSIPWSRSTRSRTRSRSSRDASATARHRRRADRRASRSRWCSMASSGASTRASAIDLVIVALTRSGHPAPDARHPAALTRRRHCFLYFARYAIGRVTLGGGDHVRHRRFAALLAVLALTVVAAACGNDDGGGGEGSERVEARRARSSGSRSRRTRRGTG